MKTSRNIPGNLVDKGSLRNPIAMRLAQGFDRKIVEYAKTCSPHSILEVGCGEGRLSIMLLKEINVPVKACDVGEELIQNNIRNAEHSQALTCHFYCKSIYDLHLPDDYGELVVCCEVMEHLDHPDRALDALRRLNAKAYIFSVPNEPIWRVLNLIRGAYWRNLGNTPGHIQHWSTTSFIELLHDNNFSIVSSSQPLPWTVVLATGTGSDIRRVITITIYRGAYSGLNMDIAV